MAPRLVGSLSAVLLAIALPAAAADRPDGARLFMNHCAACHGAHGEGDGPVAATMQTTVPNLRTLAQRNGGTFPADAVTAYIDGRQIKAAHGDRQMPIWGDVFRGPEQGTAERTVRERIAALVAFVKGIQYPPAAGQR
ncbi:MAG TPA: cytochrome c [Gammaproteobacteria bacterium]|jgi:mono/diheme cytochrome c family protein|nr:cytochrome c [Gammaproteobacteria bacterium]